MSHASGIPAQARDAALIIADDIGIFLAVARSLGRAGIAVDIATPQFDFPGLQSCYIRHVHRVPGYLAQPQDWAEAIAALDEQHEYSWIVPTSDSSLVLMKSFASTLGPEKLAIVNAAAFEVFSDKAETRRVAEKAGIPIARGMVIRPGTDSCDAVGRLGLPLVLKPQTPYATGDTQAKIAATIIYRADELQPALDRLGNREILAEQFFHGDGVGVSVLARNGEILLAWQHRRLAEVSETGRSCRRIGEQLNPALEHDVKLLCELTRLTGIAMFEFRQNKDTGKYILIEVNARFWGSLSLAVAAGFDFPFLYWQMALNERQAPDQPKRHLGLSKVDLSGEFDRLSLRASVGGIRAIVLALIGVVHLMAKAHISPSSFDSWAEDDPRPLRAEVFQIYRHIRDAILRRISKFES